MKQEGFTLIEVLVALPISVVALSAIVISIFLVTGGSIDVRNEMVAQADIQNAAHWLTRDIIMGQSIDLLEGAEPAEQMTLDWVDFTGGVGSEVSHYVIYTHSGTELLREYDSVGNTTIAGRNITDVGFSLEGNLVTVTLTSSAEGTSASTVTRTYLIEMRAKEE